MQKPGKSGRERGTVDMSAPGAQFCYKPPPCTDPLDQHNYPIILVPKHEARVRVQYYRKRVVDFSLSQLYLPDGDGAKHEVHRTDCDHGEVHEHQFYRSGSDERRTVVEVIPATDSWACVDSHWNRAHDEVFTRYLDRFERWCRG